jgi:hypothetical protein
MPAYIVRLRSNRDLVGIFVAFDPDELEFVVNECTDVEACEYLEMPDGGIMWTDPAIPVPIDPGDSEDPEHEIPELPWARCDLTEDWWSVVYGFSDRPWTPFDPDAPQDPPQQKRQRGPGQIIPMRRKKD